MRCVLDEVEGSARILFDDGAAAPPTTLSVAKRTNMKRAWQFDRCRHAIRDSLLAMRRLRGAPSWEAELGSVQWFNSAGLLAAAEIAEDLRLSDPSLLARPDAHERPPLVRNRIARSAGLFYRRKKTRIVRLTISRGA